MSRVTPKEVLEVLTQIEKDSPEFTAPAKTIENLTHYAEAVSEIWADENLSGLECVDLVLQMFELVNIK